MEDCGKNINEVQKRVEKNEDALNAQLWIPVALTISYIYILRVISQEWPQEPLSTFGQCSVLVPLTASVLYLSLIYFGKKYMANREAINVKNYMFTYNLYQTVLNAWCVYSFIAEIFKQGYPVWGNLLHTTNFQMGFLIWIHYNNKYVELLDTFFMVVRKKDRQISFLHVYHHVLLIWAWFAVCKFGCGGDAYFGAMANSFIHVIMYGYYLMALLNIPCPWKHYITQLQLVQFVVCLINALYNLITGQYPYYLCFIQIFVMMNMLVLFVNFYKQNYTPKKNTTQTKAE